MQDALNDLLQAELEAEQVVKQSELEREAIKLKALADANSAIEQFNARLPELHQSFLDKANERAEQSVAELKLRYDERNQQLRQLAEKHQEEALSDALNLLLQRPH